MAKSCTVMAHAVSPNGEIVESRLFNDLLHYTSDNRELAMEYYALGTDKEFLEGVKDRKEFKTDENGEITFKSLRTLADMDLETDEIIQILNKDIGEGVYDYDTALNRVRNFNDSNTWSDRALAMLEPAGNGKYHVFVVPKATRIKREGGAKEEVAINADNQKKLFDAVRNEELKRRLVTLLKSYKVSVDFIENEKEGGRYSTENISNLENGLYGLIQVNEAGNVSDVLAEEAGHFAVGALGDNPLVQRLEKLLESKDVQKEAIGAEEYDNANLGDNPAREIAGRLVGKALKRKLDEGAAYNVLANRIANLAKRVFYRLMGNDVRWAAAKAEQEANRIAYQFEEGSSDFKVENAINIEETMRSSRLTTNQKVYRDVMDEFGRMVNQLKAVTSDDFTGKAQASFGMAAVSGTDWTSGKSALQMEETVDLATDSLALSGIIQAVIQLYDYLGEGKEIDQRIKAVDFANPSDFYNNMARNGRNLRQAKIFLRSASTIVDIIEKATQPQYLGGALKNAGGSDSLRKVINIDAFGTRTEHDLLDILDKCRYLIGKHHIELNNKESAYFARFCEDMYGSKYITTVTGILWNDIRNKEGESAKEQNISIEDLVSGEDMQDIDIFHRYLGSMSNNPDIIGQIVDKVVRTANKSADDVALNFKDRLLILKERAKKLGLDTADLLEKDDEGIPTGNMVTPPATPNDEDPEEAAICLAYMDEIGTDDPNEVYAVNYGKWEKAREAKKKKCWEDFKLKNPTWKTMPGIVRGSKWDLFYKKEYDKWNEKNSLKAEVVDPNTGEVLYVKWVPNRKYKEDTWFDLRAKYKKTADGDTLDKWMHDYRKIKRELDSMLPVASTQSQRLPQFKGTFMNSVRQSMALEKGSNKGLNAWRKTFGRRVILESFVETAEDEDFGDMSTMNSPDEELLGNVLNYENERANRLPIFGINKLQNLQDLDSDIIGSTIAYASMASTYYHMSTIIDSLEVGKDAMYNREIKGKNTWVEDLARKAGNKFREYRGINESYYTGFKNRAYSRYLKYLEKQVYGISATHYTIPFFAHKRLVLNKLIQNISSLGGSLFLKGNVLGGTVNTLTGFFNIFKEAITGDYFDSADWLKAHEYYFANLPKLWGESSLLQKDNQLSLFLERMNAQSNNKGKMRQWRSERSRWNNMCRNVWYLPYSSGDHYMQAMSYLAVANGTKLYNEDGTFGSNLWDAFTTVDRTDEFGGNVTGKTLEFKKFSPLNSTDITSVNLSKGIYLRPVTRSTADFEEWLSVIEPRFILDAGYRRDHSDDYINYRRQYDALSEESMMRFKSDRYQMLSDILQKVENYISSSGTLGPLATVPAFTSEEKEYLRVKGIGEGDYDSILQNTKDDIYNIIWTQRDESSYMDKCREINNRLHGIYNEQDKTAWHQQWYTNAFLAMKGWALGYLEMMYSPNHYSTILGKNVEGFMNTEVKLLWRMAREFKHDRRKGLDMLISAMAPWSERSSRIMKEAGFSEEQNFNARRFAMSVMLILGLKLLQTLTAKPGGDGDDDEEEEEDAYAASAYIHYFATRTLLEQEALLEANEAFIQSGQLMDFMPVGGAALYDLWTLADEGFGAMTTDEDDEDYSKYYHPKDDKKERWVAGDAKFWDHLMRITPYVKNSWALDGHMREAEENYMFGRKLRTR